MNCTCIKVGTKLIKPLVAITGKVSLDQCGHQHTMYETAIITTTDRPINS